LEIYGDVHFRLNDIEAAVLHWKQAMDSGCATEKLKFKIDNKKPE
jgi:predicted negative regulator of RcsB-dependent stress response